LDNYNILSSLDIAFIYQSSRPEHIFIMVINTKLFGHHIFISHGICVERENVDLVVYGLRLQPGKTRQLHDKHDDLIFAFQQLFFIVLVAKINM
jgi:hypothetical protein